MNPETLLLKLKDAFASHDMESLIDCFDGNYISEQPVHPNRFFRGADTVKDNWTSNFNEMPDFTARLLNYSVNENTIWAEWEWQGTRQDSSVLHMTGVTIFGIENGKISWGRLYMEPIEKDGPGIETVIKEVMHGKGE
jgi:hypothetical protein